MKILNVWNSKKEDFKFYYVDKPIFELGEYKIFKQFEKSYLHTYKDISISQLGGANKELLKSLVNNIRPMENGKYSPQTFLFDRAKENLKRGIDLIN